MVAAAVALIYASADRVVGSSDRPGSGGGAPVAFLLLCVGTQILINGLTDVIAPLLAAR